jgi:tetratricopeptide (TPR) repeat protein
MAVPADWLTLAPKPRPLKGNDKWNVFLSYRSVNRIWVLNLYDVLRQQGFEVFLDQVVLAGGAELIKTLEEGLSRSQAGVLVWSSASVDSDWVRREYQTLESQSTSKAGFCFVPVRLDASPIPVFAREKVFFDFSSYPDGPNGGELLRLLHAIVGQALSEEAARFAAEQDGLASRAAAEVDAAIMLKKPDQLIALYAADGLPWKTSSALACKAAEGMLKLKRNDDAIKMLEQIEKEFPNSIRPQQLHALALARRGTGDDLDKAQQILGRLYASGERDPETVGIFGRTWMDRYQHSNDVSDLQQSRDLYEEAFDRAADDYYIGINAASKSVLLATPEDIDRAAQLAERVQQIVGTEPIPGNYWKTATAGEVFLLKKKYADAGRLYNAAVAMARAETGSQESTWKQACRLMEKLQPTAEERVLVRAAFSRLPDCDQMLA